MLTTAERNHAREQGWDLHHVYDLGKGSWSAMVLPIVFSREVTVPKALEVVMAYAKTNDAVAIKALREITKFNMKGKKS